jgi:hypothetical protein
VSGQSHVMAALIYKKDPGTHGIVGRVGHRASMDDLALAEIEASDPPARSRVAILTELCRLVQDNWGITT